MYAPLLQMLLGRIRSSIGTDPLYFCFVRNLAERGSGLYPAPRRCACGSDRVFLLLLLLLLLWCCVVVNKHLVMLAGRKNAAPFCSQVRQRLFYRFEKTELGEKKTNGLASGPIDRLHFLLPAYTRPT